MQKLFVILLLLLPCYTISAQSVGSIPAPAGFTRTTVTNGSFGQWLRTISLKKDKTVYLYNGQPKRYQGAQFAVLDISTGTKDLQQCADAVIRLRAEWQYAHHQFNQIAFRATDGTVLDYASWQKGCRFKLSNQRLVKVCNQATGNDRSLFQSYLELVFSYAGTASLQKELKAVTGADNIKPGAVFVQGGSPGHAVIVLDVVANNKGERKFMLAQSYMPAQDMHILKNPANGSCWYDAALGDVLETPEWTFRNNALYNWPGEQ